MGIAMRAEAATAWDALAELRRRGRFPKLVIVTDDPKMPLRGTGDFVIEHPGDEPAPLHLLEDLNVIFWFKTCAHAGLHAHEARVRRIQFARARCYCACACAINVASYDCRAYPALDEWLAGVA